MGKLRLQGILEVTTPAQRYLNLRNAFGHVQSMPQHHKLASGIKGTQLLAFMLAARRTIRRPKARSSAGTRRSRTAFCSRTLPGDFKSQIARFVEHYNYRRYHENLQKLTPADIYFGRSQTILLERKRIKADTIKQRRLQRRPPVSSDARVVPRAARFVRVTRISGGIDKTEHLL